MLTLLLNEENRGNLGRVKPKEKSTENPEFSVISKEKNDSIRGFHKRNKGGMDGLNCVKIFLNLRFCP